MPEDGFGRIRLDWLTAGRAAVLHIVAMLTDLQPKSKGLVYDLVSEAGVDTSD